MCGIIIGKMNYFDRARYFRTKKRLGQNFLIDGQTIADIIDFADVQPDDTVLEIGPGVGFVTEQLVKHAKQVIAVELDEEAIREELKKDKPNQVEKFIIKNEKIPDSFNGIKIIQFSDLYYGSTIEDKEIDKLIKEINKRKSDCK